LLLRLYWNCTYLQYTPNPVNIFAGFGAIALQTKPPTWYMFPSLLKACATRGLSSITGIIGFGSGRISRGGCTIGAGFGAGLGIDCSITGTITFGFCRTRFGCITGAGAGRITGFSGTTGTVGIIQLTHLLLLRLTQKTLPL